MKLLTFLFGTVISLLTITSCKKSVDNNGLTGNWKLVERYDGYAMGGSFNWHSVAPEYSHILTFNSDGKYFKTEGAASQNNCVGTYLLQTDNRLEINSNCNTVTERVFVSILTPETLVIDRAVIEGTIRYKYSASK